MADVVCLGGLACRRCSARRPARLLFLAASRRLPAALARGRSGRGARAPERSEERRGPRPGLRARSASAFSAASASPTPPMKNGLARRSPAPTPDRGAQRREHQRRVRRRVRERRVQALQRPRDRARTARPRRFDIAFRRYVKGPAEGRTRRREGRPRGAKRSATSAVPGPIAAVIGMRP